MTTTSAAASLRIIDATKLAAFKACPRKFFLAYVLGFRPEWPKNHLIFGQAWHKALELLWLGRSVEEAFSSGFLPCYRAVFPPSTDEAFFPKTPSRARLGLEAYAAHWSDDLERYEVLATEQVGTFEVSSGWLYYCKVDTLVRNRESGLLELIEHKSGGATRPSFFEKWELTTQILGYNCWLSEQEALNAGTTIDHFGFLKAKGTRGGKLFEPVRVTVTHTERQFSAFRRELTSWFMLLERALETWELEANPLWFLRSFQCDHYGGCEYRALCAGCAELRPGEPPEGFRVEFWDPRTQEPKTSG